MENQTNDIPYILYHTFSFFAIILRENCIFNIMFIFSNPLPKALKKACNTSLFHALFMLYTNFFVRITLSISLMGEKHA